VAALVEFKTLGTFKPIVDFVNRDIQVSREGFLTGYGVQNATAWMPITVFGCWCFVVVEQWHKDDF
jgi:hypothetical protein